MPLKLTRPTAPPSRVAAKLAGAPVPARTNFLHHRPPNPFLIALMEALERRWAVQLLKSKSPPTPATTATTSPPWHAPAKSPDCPASSSQS